MEIADILECIVSLLEILIAEHKCLTLFFASVLINAGIREDCEAGCFVKYSADLSVAISSVLSG